MAEKYANLFTTALGAPADPGDTTIAVADPAPTALHSGQFRIKVGGELMLVTSGQDTTTWTVTRGVESTTAAAHSAGLSVQHYLTAGALGNIVSEGSSFAWEQSHYRGWEAVDIASLTGFDWDSTLNAGNELLDLSGDTTNPGFLDTTALYAINAHIGFTGGDEDITKTVVLGISGTTTFTATTAQLSGPGGLAPQHSAGLVVPGTESIYIDLTHDFGAGLTVAALNVFIAKMGGS